MPALAEIGTEYYLFGGAVLVSLLAFGALILAPAVGSYGRTWEKATAAAVAFFILAALVFIGVGIGILIVYFWDDISTWLP